MSVENDFKGKQFPPNIILINLRWYTRYALTYRDLVEIMAERGVKVTHTTIMYWIHEYSPIFNKRIRPKLQMTGDSWKLDESYIKVKGEWKYLYRAVDKEGNTLDFHLTAYRDQLGAMRFLKKLLNAIHTITPRVINTDKNAAYIPAFEST